MLHGKNGNHRGQCELYGREQCILGQWRMGEVGARCREVSREWRVERAALLVYWLSIIHSKLAVNSVRETLRTFFIRPFLIRSLISLCYPFNVLRSNRQVYSFRQVKLSLSRQCSQMSERAVFSEKKDSLRTCSCWAENLLVLGCMGSTCDSLAPYLLADILGVSVWVNIYGESCSSKNSLGSVSLNFLVLVRSYSYGSSTFSFSFFFSLPLSFNLSMAIFSPLKKEAILSTASASQNPPSSAPTSASLAMVEFKRSIKVNYGGVVCTQRLCLTAWGV